MSIDSLLARLDRIETAIAIYTQAPQSVPDVVTLTEVLTVDEVRQRYPSPRPQTKRIAVAPHWIRRLTAKQQAKLLRSGYRPPLYLLEIIKNNRWNRSTLNKVGGRFERWEELG